MTKKEQDEMAALRQQVADAQARTRIASALRFTEAVAPDLPKPETSSNKLNKGYLFNASTNRVEPACSSSNGHAFGSQTRTTTQRGVDIYSTRLLALRGLRHAVEQQCAERLADIDVQIEQELAR